MKTRLQRFLADCGVASRRQCEEIILAGRVLVNGEPRTEMPVMIDPENDVITVDAETIAASGGKPKVSGGGVELHEQQKVYFLLNKPKGILVTNHDPSNRKTVGELMTGVRERVFPVGRLDMDSRGALIMTNDGELANRLTHPRYGIEKTYIVEVDGRLEHGELEKIKRGIWLGPERPGGQGATKTDRFHVKLIGRERGRTIIEVKLTEAKNREIRRVMAKIGHTVRDLNRVAIAGKITTKGLEVGEHRPLTEQEIKWLLQASAPEFHATRQASTQAWYEAKEMEKERKRLAREVHEPAPASTAQEDDERNADVEPAPAPKGTHVESRKPVRRRPERKGRKPFVPPSGRNAGIPLGGNTAGRKRMERDAEGMLPEAPLTDLPEHPLGSDAMMDD